MFLWLWIRQMPFSYLSGLGYVCASWETKITKPVWSRHLRLHWFSSGNSGAPHTCFYLLLSWYTAAVSQLGCCSPLLQGYLWVVTLEMQPSSEECLRWFVALSASCSPSLGRQLSESETSFHFFTFGHLGRLTGSLLSQVLRLLFFFFFFSFSWWFCKAELVFAFVRENMDSIAQKNGD